MKDLIKKELETEKSEWQAVLNVFYNKWQNKEYNQYSDMIEAANKVDPLYAYAILAGKYNQQVYNGGHMQYFDNGYASCDTKGCFSPKNNLELHEKLIELHERFFPKIPKKLQLLFILNDFMDKVGPAYKACEWCDGNGEIYEEDDYTDEYGYNAEIEQCSYCNGSGEDESYDQLELDDNGELDSKYYDLNIEQILDEYFAKVIPESCNI